MLPFGYWSNTVSYSDCGTLGSLSTPGSSSENGESDRDPFASSVAPSVESLEHCQLSVVTRESQIMFKKQVEVLMEKMQEDTTNFQLDKGPEIYELPESNALIFTISNLVGLSSSIKYLACEIHDRFIAQQNEDLGKLVTGMAIDAYNLQLLEVNTQDLALVRLAACVQLASKMNAAGSKHRDVGAADVQKLLEIFQCYVTTDVIQKTELRIFTLLNFNLNIVTRLDAVEAILIQLGLTIPEYRQVYTHATNLLDHFYLSKLGIRNEFYAVMAIRNRNVYDWKLFLRDVTESNKFIEGSAAVIGAMVIHHMEDQPAFHVACGVVKDRVDIETVRSLVIACIHCTQTDPKRIINSSKTLRFWQPTPLLFTPPLVSPTSTRTT